MAVEGSLDLFQLPEILQIISQEQKTGILTVQGHDDIVAISFLNGHVVSADALNKTLEDGLGEVLLERKLVTRRDYDEAMAEKRRSNCRLMDALVDTGALERQELLEALRLLTHDLLSELLSWREGEFKFYGGDEVSFEEGFRPIAVEDLLLANLPQATEKAPKPHPEPDRKPQPTRPAAAPDPPVAKAAPAAAAPVPVPVAPPKPVEPDLGALDLRPPRALAEEPPRPHLPRPAPSYAMRAEESAPSARLAGGGLRGAVSWGLGILAAVLLVASLITFPVSFLLPSSSNARERAALIESRRNAHYSKIETALRTFALLEAARLPEQLEVLVQIGMLSNEEVLGALGQPLLYETDGQIYRLRPLLTEEEDAFTGSLSGDFLRDLALLQEPGARATKPLVLLD